MLTSKVYLIVLVVLRCSNCFLVGDCIGPKSALERHLDKSERSVLRSIVHENFNGKNSQEVMRLVLTFVRSRLSQNEWTEIQPEIRAHEARKPECSIYAQLLPSELYRRLLQRVWDASERGANQAQIRTIVDRFVADLTQRGELPTVPPKAAVGAAPSSEERPAPRARRTFPTLLQYPEEVRYPVEVTLPWYAQETPVDWPDQRVVARKIVPEVRQSSFVPLPAAQPVRWMHSGSQHVPARRPTVSVFPTLIPPLGAAVERTEDADPEEEDEDTEAPVFERFSFGNDLERASEILTPSRPLPIPVAKMPRIRLSDGRYMRPPLTLKAARAMATRTPRTTGTTSHLRGPLQTSRLPSPSSPPPASPAPSTPRHSRRRRPLAPSPQLTFPRIQPRFGAPETPAPISRRHHPALIELN